MARQFSLALALLLLSSGCAVVADSSGGSHQGTGVIGDSDGNTTDKIEFFIEQTEPPVTMAGTSAISVRFDMELKNVTDTDLKLKRISLQSVGSGPVEIMETRWNYDKTIRPGETERIEFWAKVNAGSSRLGANVPVITRSTVLFSDAGEQTEALFTRRVNGRFAVAIGL
jgi:hypothetical protein